MDEKTFEAGTELFREGDAGDTAYLVVSGKVEIWREVDDERSVLGLVEPGELLGEMALINDQPRMATATALEDTVCVAVPTAVFNSELDDISAFLKALILNLIGRLRSMSDNLESYQQAEAEKEGVVFFRPDEDGEYHEAE